MKIVKTIAIIAIVISAVIFLFNNDESDRRVDVEHFGDAMKMALKDIRVDSMVWGEDSQKLFFRYDDWIHSIDLDGNNFSELGIGDEFVISNDGNKIFFVAHETFEADGEETGKFEQYVLVMDTDGNNHQVVGNVVTMSKRPYNDISLSPSGQYAALRIERDIQFVDPEDGIITQQVSGLGIWRFETGELEIVDSFISGWCMRWSPDGSKLAVEGHTDEVSHNRDIWIYDTIDNSLTNISSDLHDDAENSHSFEPLWSPDGSMIVYTSLHWFEGEPHSATKIWASNVDGSEKYLLATESVGKSYRLGIYDWNPDASEVAFVSPTNDSCVILRMDIQGNNPEILYSMPINCSSVHGLQWSPDGTMIAAKVYRHMSSSMPSTDIYLIEVQ